MSIYYLTQFFWVKDLVAAALGDSGSECLMRWLSPKGLTGARTSISKVVHAHGGQVGAGPGREASAPPRVGVSIETLEHPHHMAAGFPEPAIPGSKVTMPFTTSPWKSKPFGILLVTQASVRGPQRGGSQEAGGVGSRLGGWPPRAFTPPEAPGSSSPCLGQT